VGDKVNGTHNQDTESGIKVKVRDEIRSGDIIFRTHDMEHVNEPIPEQKQARDDKSEYHDDGKPVLKHHDLTVSFYFGFSWHFSFTLGLIGLMTDITIRSTQYPWIVATFVTIIATTIDEFQTFAKSYMTQISTVKTQWTFIEHINMALV
jgi:hypothetical protein